jgi:hypothetical protein
VKPNVKSEALAFRIWQYAAPREWNVTLAEIADHLGESQDRVRGVVVAKGWNTRVRHTGLSKIDYGHGAVFAGHARTVAADLAAGRIGNGESI